MTCFKQMLGEIFTLFVFIYLGHYCSVSIAKYLFSKKQKQYLGFPSALRITSRGINRGIKRQAAPPPQQNYESSSSFLFLWYRGRGIWEGRGGPQDGPKCTDKSRYIFKNNINSKYLVSVETIATGSYHSSLCWSGDFMG